jgi:disulfide bond formation protein DsbB
MRWSAPTTYLFTGLAAWAAIAVALFLQHQFGMEPCPWCVLQRVIYAFIGALGVLGWLARPKAIHASCGVLMTLLGLSGIGCALYQHFVAAKSLSCKMTFADQVIRTVHADRFWPAIFEVRASCAEAAVNLLGIPFEFWSAVFFGLLIIGALMALRRSGTVAA